MKYKEIEFKYKADGISLTEFKNFCEGRVPKKDLSVSGFDHFYSKKGADTEFCRLRMDPTRPQLTFKKKTSEKNNFTRDEINVNLGTDVDREIIEALVSKFGYAYNTSIFKTCFIFIYDWYTLVYYTCYDKEMKELGRFIEIEMNEDYAWNSEEEAWSSLIDMERLCKTLGISPQARIKRSLFEMYCVEKASNENS